MEVEEIKIMPCSGRLILLSVLAVFFLPLAGCNGGGGGLGLQNKESASVSISASATSVTEGQAVMLEAYVYPTLATGTVTFYNGSTAIGSAAIGSTGYTDTGIALLETTFHSTGPQSITAHYSGNDFYLASASAAMSIGVYSNQLTSTSVALQASTSTPQYQTSVTFTAAVTPSSATGTVTFYNGGTNIGSVAVSAGTASLTTSFAAGGTAILHAVYSGDFNYASSTSNSLTLNVTGPLVTSTTLTSSTRTTAVGDSVILTANLTPATTTGTVTFYDQSTSIGTANVNAGVATLNTTFATSGNHSLKAVFAGNASWEASTSNQVILFLSGTTPDTVVLQVAPSSLVIGYSATLTATASPAAATGDILFYDGGSNIGMCQLTGGTCSLEKTFMTAGAQSLSVTYSGDTTYILNSSSAVSLNVSNPGSTPTTTTLTLSENTGNSGDTVTLTVNMTPAAATGQVDFYDNGSLLESVVLSSGQAAWSQVFTQDGDNSITANYDGDVTYAPSVSSPQDLEISDASEPPPPTCPTDPILCQIECPGDPTCPSVIGRTLKDRKQGFGLDYPLKLKASVLNFEEDGHDAGDAGGPSVPSSTDR
jgi:hypothetical protein